VALLSLRDIDKSYGAVRAIQGVSLDLHAARVHALVGDNGAGKSTLVKIISGALQPDHGEILLNDVPVRFSGPFDALNQGIATVFQDLALIPTRDVAHNMFVGKELRRWGIWVDQRRMEREASSVLNGLRIHNMPSVRELVSRLSGGQRQAVAIGRAVHEGRSLLVLDEPTAALGVRESHQVLSLIDRLRDQGMSVLVVSHNLAHVFRVSDQIIVMHGGRIAGIRDKAQTDQEEIVRLITGVEQSLGVV